MNCVYIMTFCIINVPANSTTITSTTVTAMRTAGRCSFLRSATAPQTISDQRNNTTPPMLKPV